MADEDDLEMIRRRGNAFGDFGAANADQLVIKLNDEQWKAFVAALDAAPKPRPRLKRLLNEPTILN